MSMVEQTVNKEIEDKIRRTLTPYLGVGNFQVSIAARLNLDRSTVSEVIYDPNSRVERSVRTVKENALAQNSTSEAAVSAQQNLPDQKTGGDAGKNSNETNDRREETTNYEVSSKTVETSHDGYKIERLSIAVLVNKTRLESVASQGANALPVEHQLMDIEQLVGAAAGLSKDRGDQLKVASVDFVNDAPQDTASPGIFDTLLAQVGYFVNSFALIALAFITVLFGLRPAVRAILAQPSPARAAQEPALEAAPAAAAIAAGIGASEPRSGDEANLNLIEDVTKRMNRSPQKRLEQIVEYNEEQAVAILRQWLHQDEAA
jgi:flagellar M-ring protein FliF